VTVASAAAAAATAQPRRDAARRLIPWFLKPYEPSATETVSTKPELPKNNRPKPKVAALLGGMPKR
jgi:hypothetical protein